MTRMNITLHAACLLASSSMAAPLPDLKSLSVDLPDAVENFSGAGSGAANSNCLGCHSVEMVLNQPNLPRAVWEAEINKMIKVYKAPIDSNAIEPIVEYLVSIKIAK